MTLPPAGRAGADVHPMTTLPGPLITAMMTGAIDYAGLFPPAARPMADAVDRYAAYHNGPHAWMLGRFVVPVGRLEELAEAHAAHHAVGPAAWPLSAIARASDAAALAAFNARYGSRLHVDMVEAPRATAESVEALAPLAPTYDVYAEVDVTSDPTPVIAACARHGIGAKIRTGGVTTDAFPAPAQVARFLITCRDARVRFKATAGLHHAWRAVYPLTYAPDAPRGTMFGFASVVLAAVASASGASADELVTILTANADAFTITRGGAALPSGRAVDAERVAAARLTGLRSFGSCSFDEPVTELISGKYL